MGRHYCCCSRRRWEHADNAATRKVKWLPQPPATDEACIDLVHSDEDGDSKEDDCAIARIATDTDDDDDDDNDDEDYEDEREVDGDDELDGEEVDSVDKRIKPRSPFLAIWLVPIIRQAITDAPMTSNQGLKEILKFYGNDFAFTKSIMQKARTLAQ